LAARVFAYAQTAFLPRCAIAGGICQVQGRCASPRYVLNRHRPGACRFVGVSFQIRIHPLLACATNPFKLNRRVLIVLLEGQANSPIGLAAIVSGKKLRTFAQRLDETQSRGLPSAVQPRRTNRKSRGCATIRPHTPELLRLARHAGELRAYRCWYPGSR